MRDLSAFEKDNAKWKRANKRVPLDQRAGLVRKHFPSMELDWHDILETEPDPATGQALPVGIFAFILRDVFSYDPDVKLAFGQHRPELTTREMHQVLARAGGEDYSDLSFQDTFALLTRDHSTSQVARKTGLSRTHVHRLRKGEQPPSIDDIRAIAKAYGKDPSYFHEYRVEFVLQAVADRLAVQADQTIVLYRRLLQAVL